jgi:lambda repressor-like predicted transcriptional regulator
MNRLPIGTRTQILNMLCEGSSMRSISRIAGVSINTVTKLLEDAGEVCAAFHDEHERRVKAKRVQVDEIWSFTYAKAKNVTTAKAAPDGAGDTWTWTALEADTKLIVSWTRVARRAATSSINHLAQSPLSRCACQCAALHALQTAFQRKLKIMFIWLRFTPFGITGFAFIKRFA